MHNQDIKSSESCLPHSTFKTTAQLSLPFNNKNPIILNASESVQNSYQTQDFLCLFIKTNQIRPKHSNNYKD